MTRDELIKAIYDSDEVWSCLDHPCEFAEESDTGYCCIKCAEKQLSEYEAKIRAEAIDEIIDIVAIACNFDDDNKAEMKKYILEQLKERK